MFLNGFLKVLFHSKCQFREIPSRIGQRSEAQCVCTQLTCSTMWVTFVVMWIVNTHARARWHTNIIVFVCYTHVIGTPVVPGSKQTDGTNLWFCEWIILLLY